MKNLDTVKIEQAIVHQVDPKKSVLTLSSRALTMSKTSELAEYFQEHIKNSLADPTARTAAFKIGSVLQPNTTTALNSPSKFLEMSQK